MHQPFGDVYGQWRAMEALNRAGTAKAIGVANFSPDRLLDLILNNEITPAVNQIETHPFFQRVGYQALMDEHGVRIQSWGGFAEGENDLFGNPLLAAIGAGGAYGREHRRLRLPAHGRADGQDRHPRHRLVAEDGSPSADWTPDRRQTPATGDRGWATGRRPPPFFCDPHGAEVTVETADRRPSVADRRTIERIPFGEARFIFLRNRCQHG